MTQKALVRADQGQPLERILVERGKRVFYMANPERWEAVLAGISGPVGFPQEDVFVFDAELYADLRAQWDREHRTDNSLWDMAVRLD